MCDQAILNFVEENIGRPDIAGKSVLEVGSRDVNGSVRGYLSELGPKSYLGVDIVEGKSVDQICDVENLLLTYGEGAFDVVISTEMLEHVKDWRRAVRNLKGVVAPNGGLLIISTRSFGFPYHDYPGDYWRYEISDMKEVFCDFDICKLESDTIFPGVLMIARKPDDFRELELDSILLYSIALGRRAASVDDSVAELHDRRWKMLTATGRKTRRKLFSFPWALLSENTFQKAVRLLAELETLLTEAECELSEKKDAKSGDSQKQTICGGEA